jgi:peptidoglycan/xylan/chitin deacetylase (PgdA/CDA1 family)
MLQRLARTGIACALHWTGANKLIGVLNGSRNMPLVLNYHRVVEDYAASAGQYMPEMLVSRRTLERHLDWLGRRYRFLSLDELGARLESGEPFNKPVAAITFDDGYRDVYDHAFPLLKRKGIPSAVFVVTDLIGTSRLQIYDKLYLLLHRAFSLWRSVPCDLARLLHGLGIRLPMLGMDEVKQVRHLAKDPFTAMRVLFTALPHAELYRVIEALAAEVEIDESELKELHVCSWDMLAELHRAGVTIGSHTQTHALLTNEHWHKVLDETAGSRQVLERKLGLTIKHFAYPNGSFDAAAVRAVAVSGYGLAYTTCLHRNLAHPLLTIPRTFLWENSCMDALGHFSPSIMSCKAHRVFDAFAPCNQHHDWTSESPRSPAAAVTVP